MQDFKRLRKGNVVYHDDGPYVFLDERYTIIESTKGEFVKLNNSRVLTVTFPLNDGSMGTYFAEDIEPIHISPMWLEKLGFKPGQFDLRHNGKIIEGSHYEKGQNCIHFSEAGYRLLVNGQRSIEPLNYIHELQNIYFYSGLGELTIEGHV